MVQSFIVHPIISLVSHSDLSFKKFAIFLDYTVDWEMGICAPHLVPEPLEKLEFWRRVIGMEVTFVTPMTMLFMRDLIVRKHATCFLPPCHTASKTLFFDLDLISWMSMLVWRTFFESFPRGPDTSMRRDLMDTVTSSGISRVSVWRTSRIYECSLVRVLWGATLERQQPSIPWGIHWLLRLNPGSFRASKRMAWNQRKVHNHTYSWGWRKVRISEDGQLAIRS